MNEKQAVRTKFLKLLSIISGAYGLLIKNTNKQKCGLWVLGYTVQQFRRFNPNLLGHTQ